MDIPFGRSLALVGVNGAGKSTLVKLLCRLYDPTRGRITWDGVDLKDVDIADFRDRISAVFQDYMSYDLSASENIGVGDLVNLEDRDKIETAAKQADVDEFIRGLPKGYDTMLSRIFFQGEDNEDPEQGMTLSGGQWQRVALARAMMLCGRDLLILDEPSAGLDAAAEQAVHDRLSRVPRGGDERPDFSPYGCCQTRRPHCGPRRGTYQRGRDALRAHSRDGEYARLFNIQAANYVGDVEIPLKAAPPNRLTPDLDKDRAMDAGPVEGARTAAAVRARFLSIPNIGVAVVAHGVRRDVMSLVIAHVIRIARFRR